MKKISRKKFLRNSAFAALGTATALSSCQNNTSGNIESPNIQTNKKYRWKMVTTWPPNFPVTDEGCKLIADWVKAMSNGRFEIKVYGGGELVPPLETFDAVQSGSAELGHGASYYWAGKVPAAQFFTTVPFGMNSQQMNAWILCGGGMELWKKCYSNFNIVPMIAGNTGVQMAGWFNKEINSIEDLKGLKMRIPGLGGKVLNKAGGTAVLSPGSELYTNLERGIIDATEWIGPYHDYKMGFYQIAKYYYTPGWHETGSVLEMIVNKQKFESLPKDLQVILETACMRANQWILSEFEAKNAAYMRKLVDEEGVQIKNLPKEVLAQLKLFTKEVLEEDAANDPLFKEVYDSFKSFKADISQWSAKSEKEFYNNII